MDIKKILSTKVFKAGYEVRAEICDGSEWGGDDLEMKSAYSVNGDYIGNPKHAKRLCCDRGIAPQLSAPSNNVCSIGYSAKDGKWYGWSHRAIYGFKVGSKIKKGDCGYVAANKKDFIENEKAFWLIGDCENRNMNVKRLKTGIQLTYESKNVSGDWNEYSHFCEWVLGRGEWTASNITDAKQMAVDFAEGVS